MTCFSPNQLGDKVIQDTNVTKVIRQQKRTTPRSYQIAWDFNAHTQTQHMTDYTPFLSNNMGLQRPYTNTTHDGLHPVPIK